MMKNKENNEPIQNLVSNPTDYMESFRKNIDILMKVNGYSVRKLSDEADMPYETLKSFIYGYSKDCKLSTAVKLARVFGLSIDELVGADTIEEKSRESLAMSRSMPDHVMYLIRSFIRHQYTMYSKLDPRSFNIPVLLPECVNGYLNTTNVTETICIDHLTDGLKSRIALGIRIPCEHYEPFYMPNDIVLLGVDRGGLNNEKCVISYKGHYYLAIKRVYIEDGEKKWKYISIMDGKTEILSTEIDDKFGYVIGFLNPDGTWGVR